MELIQLTESAYHLRGGSNAGLIVRDGRALLIDTGLDKDTAKKILRHLDALKAALAAVVITHAHADHFGGAATLRARTGAKVYAPSLEAAVIENPLLEPLYLFSGAMPPSELRHKFTLAEACPVDGLLAPGPLTLAGITLDILPAPGHAPNQMMVAAGGACFVADAVFAPDVLAKHGIPFMVDVDAWLTTLEAVARLDGQYASFVPGHGPAVPVIAEWVGHTAERLRRLRTLVAQAAAPSAHLGDIVTFCADRLDMAIPNLTIYLLAQTAVLACLASLQAEGAIAPAVADNALRWRATPAPG